MQLTNGSPWILYFCWQHFISQTVQKQKEVVAQSSTEVEYHVLAMPATDVLQLRHHISEFNISISSPTPIHCDNVSVIAIATSQVFHTHIKHIEIDYNFIHDHISKELNIKHIASQDQVANILTKCLYFSILQIQAHINHPTIGCST